jgi:hypothetical protein
MLLYLFLHWSVWIYIYSKYIYYKNSMLDTVICLTRTKLVRKQDLLFFPFKCDAGFTHRIATLSNSNKIIGVLVSHVCSTKEQCKMLYAVHVRDS